MMKLNRSLSRCLLASCSTLGLLAANVGGASAEVLTSPSGNYRVSIDELGNLYDNDDGFGFQRVSDGYDPIAPGDPRDAWGVAAGANSGYVDPRGSEIPGAGISNIMLTGSSGDYRSTVLLGPGDIPLLQIEHKYSFPYPAPFDNYLQINVQITNLSDVPQSVLYSRVVDWDIAPSEFFETITASALTGVAVDGSDDGFEDADPLVPFDNSTGPAGGDFGPGDLGAGLLMNLGELAPNSAPDSERRIHFSLFYGISRLGQTEAEMRAELGFTGGANRINAAVLGVGGGLGENVIAPSVLISGAAAVPEPTGVALLGIGGLGVLGLAFSRRARQMVLCRA